jgi:hypothetical protein
LRPALIRWKSAQTPGATFAEDEAFAGVAGGRPWPAVGRRPPRHGYGFCIAQRLQAEGRVHRAIHGWRSGSPSRLPRQVHEGLVADGGDSAFGPRTLSQVSTARARKQNARTVG